MNIARQAQDTFDLDCEWRRVELLVDCLLNAREHKAPNKEQLSNLESIQQQVQSHRLNQTSSWNKLPLPKSESLGLDILAAVYACEVRPKVGWAYQQLQPASPSPYPSLALLQQILALDDRETERAIELCSSHGVLQECHLIEVEGEGLFAQLRVNKNALATLMNWSKSLIAPPGAYPVKQQASWQDLVLPADKERMIREYILWITHTHIVVDKWRGHRVGGPLALFSGPSGTGKTFAAMVIASELKWPLFRVDLARLVSKYIGETEKNIGKLFDAAHGQPMILQFDEVDSLMSKRGEIKEARDRYANMEVSYLLARIEEHKGPCILTTNLRNQIDKAFSRRFQMVIDFPRPDQSARKQLWDRMLPPDAPLASDLDTDFVAQAANLTGGNIRNAALHAAYLAAEQQTAITLQHIAVAVLREIAKDRPQFSTSELGHLKQYLPATLSSQLQVTK